MMDLPASQPALTRQKQKAPFQKVEGVGTKNTNGKNKQSSQEYGLQYLILMFKTMIHPYLPKLHALEGKLELIVRRIGKFHQIYALLIVQLKLLIMQHLEHTLAKNVRHLLKAQKRRLMIVVQLKFRVQSNQIYTVLLIMPFGIMELQALS